MVCNVFSTTPVLGTGSGSTSLVIKYAGEVSSFLDTTPALFPTNGVTCVCETHPFRTVSGYPISPQYTPGQKTGCCDRETAPVFHNALLYIEKPRVQDRPPTYAPMVPSDTHSLFGVLSGPIRLSPVVVM